MTNQVQSFEFFATCLPGAERLLADELHGLGVKKVRPLSGGASFFGAPEDALRVCLWSRLAGRVNLTVGRVAARDADALYAGVRELPWETVIADGASIAVRASGTNAELRNTQFVALKVKDAICDRLAETRGARPDVKPQQPDALVEVRLREEKASLSLDLSGRSLTRRAYLGALGGVAGGDAARGSWCGRAVCGGDDVSRPCRWRQHPRPRGGGSARGSGAGPFARTMGVHGMDGVSR